MIESPVTNRLGAVKNVPVPAENKTASCLKLTALRFIIIAITDIVPLVGAPTGADVGDQVIVNLPPAMAVTVNGITAKPDPLPMKVAEQFAAK